MSNELEKKISEILFNEDPMRTSCVANESVTEYDSIAIEIVLLIEANEYFVKEMVTYELCCVLGLDIEEDDYAGMIDESAVTNAAIAISSLVK